MSMHQPNIVFIGFSFEEVFNFTWLQLQTPSPPLETDTAKQSQKYEAATK